MLWDICSDQKRRNLFLLLTQFFFDQTGETEVSRPIQHPVHAIYLLLFPGGLLITPTELSFSAIHHLRHLYTNLERCGLLCPCYMWINGRRAGDVAEVVQ